MYTVRQVRLEQRCKEREIMQGVWGTASEKMSSPLANYFFQAEPERSELNISLGRHTQKPSKSITKSPCTGGIYIQCGTAWW